MSPAVRTVTVDGLPCRVWEAGAGGRLFWLASTPLLYRWTAIHDTLAAHARLAVLSLPGMPGNQRNHEDIDDHLGWCIAARELLEAAGFRPGDTLMGSSTAGALAADVAAIWPDFVGRLILVAPHGLFDIAEPTTDMFALHPKRAAEMLSARPEVYAAQVAAPEGTEPVLWTIETARSNEATARFLWPLGDTRLARRLSRIAAPTLLIWGSADRIIPPNYASRFAEGIGGNADVILVHGAGHNAELDEPRLVADAVFAFAAIGARKPAPLRGVS